MREREKEEGEGKKGMLVESVAIFFINVVEDG